MQEEIEEQQQTTADAPATDRRIVQLLFMGYLNGRRKIKGLPVKLHCYHRITSTVRPAIHNPAVLFECFMTEKPLAGASLKVGSVIEMEVPADQPEKFESYWAGSAHFVHWWPDEAAVIFLQQNAKIYELERSAAEETAKKASRDFSLERLKPFRDSYRAQRSNVSRARLLAEIVRYICD